MTLNIEWILKYFAAPGAAVAAVVTAMKTPAVRNAVGRTWKWLCAIRVVDDAVGRAGRRWNNPVVVNRITQVTDPDLRDALELYNRRIPEGERCDEADMVRWVREDAVRRSATNNPPLTDWFFVAKYQRRVCGMIVFHYSPASRLALVAYLVTAGTPGLPVTEITAALVARIQSVVRRSREFRGFKGFVMEVEDPRQSRSKKEQTERWARIRRFRTLAEVADLTLLAFDVNYLQPRLTLDEQESEHPMLLLSARSRSADIGTLSYRAEMLECLSFVYSEVYTDGFSTVPKESLRYRQYCSELLAREAALLPDPVNTLRLRRSGVVSRNV